MRFELTRENPIGLAGQRLNHSAKVSFTLIYVSQCFINPLLVILKISKISKLINNFNNLYNYLKWEIKSSLGIHHSKIYLISAKPMKAKILKNY